MKDEEALSSTTEVRIWPCPTTIQHLHGDFSSPCQLAFPFGIRGEQRGKLFTRLARSKQNFSFASLKGLSGASVLPVLLFPISESRVLKSPVLFLALQKLNLSSTYVVTTRVCVHVVRKITGY